MTYSDDRVMARKLDGDEDAIESMRADAEARGIPEGVTEARINYLLRVAEEMSNE